jgi:hypothetical protein
MIDLYYNTMYYFVDEHTRRRNEIDNYDVSSRQTPDFNCHFLDASTDAEL